MKSTNRTDEDLIKRAKYGGRNVTALAILASMLAVIMLLGLLVLPPERIGLPLGYIAFTAGIGCIAISYWMLAMLTRQGETLALNIIAGVLAVQFVLALVGQAIVHLRTNSELTSDWLFVVISFVIVATLARNRSDLVELRRRGLAEAIFGPGRPPRSLTVLSGLMLGFGHVVLFSAIILPVLDAARAARECHNFLMMINVEEKALMEVAEIAQADAVANPNRPPDKQVWRRALDAAERLREKAKHVDEETPYGSQLKPIASTYFEATRRWWSGFAEARDAGRISPEASIKIRDGDRLREKAWAEFHREFPGLKPRQR